MEGKESKFENYVRAKNRVETIKNFYAHIVFFIIAIVLLFLFGGKIMDFVISKGITDEEFLRWVKLNIILIPIIWAIVLVFSGIYILKLKSGFLKNWEERQIQKYLKENE